MPLIRVETLIDAKIERVFDISRSVDVHVQSTTFTNEEAVAGKVSGLLEEGDWVTWEATHFFVRQRLTVEITNFNPPIYFRDIQISGPFKNLIHDHFFEMVNEKTKMVDSFSFSSPFGILGKTFDLLFLKAYLTNFLTKRNEHIKCLAEEIGV